MNRETQALTNFRLCVENAPLGKFVLEHSIATAINLAMNTLMFDLRESGFKADNCDRAFECEAAIYAYVKASNPDLASMFTVAEGVGEHS